MTALALEEDRTSDAVASDRGRAGSALDRIRQTETASSFQWPDGVPRPKGVSYHCGRWRQQRRSPGGPRLVVASSPTVEGLLEQIAQLPPLESQPRDPTEGIWPESLTRPHGTLWFATEGRWVVKRMVEGRRRVLASGRTPEALIAALVRSGHSAVAIDTPPPRVELLLKRRSLITKVWARICARNDLERDDVACGATQPEPTRAREEERDDIWRVDLPSTIPTSVFDDDEPRYRP